MAAPKASALHAILRSGSMSSLNTNADLCYSLFTKARTYREQNKDPIWQQVVDYAWGDQNIRRTTQGDQNDFVYNILYKDLNSFLALLCRAAPTFAIDPAYDALAATKTVVNTCVNQVY